MASVGRPVAGLGATRKGPPTTREPAAVQLGTEASPTSVGLHLFACFTAASTLFLILAGGLVTSTGSGLAVPDWPLSFGQVFPKMTGGVFFEHGHRLIASFVGFLTVILAGWVVLREQRSKVRALGLVALLAVILQGILGGVTVLYRLPPAVSIVHACLAQAFLCMVIALAVCTAPGWRRRNSASASVSVGVRRIAAATVAVIYGQLILGALMRHTGAGLAISDFPLALGQVIPPLTDIYVRIHFLHRLGAVAVLLSVALTLAAVLASRTADGWLRRPAYVLGALVACQVTLGALTVWSRKGAWITSSHVVVGAAVLATAMVLAMRADRDSQPRASVEVAWVTPAAEPVLRVLPTPLGAHLIDLYRLTKPRVVALISITTGVGFLVGSGPSLNLGRLLWTLLGTALAGGGSLALNQLLERDQDGKMERTRSRPLPAGRLQPTEALGFGVGLVTVGLSVLTGLAHPVAGLVTALTVFMYLFIYTPMKQKSAISTLVGTIPGALPPVTGWAAATGGLGPGAWALFGVLFFWQLPHSLAVARLWRDDYAAAGFKLLPVVDRDGPSTRRQVLLHAIALVGAGLLPVSAGIAGLGYAAISVLLGVAQLVYAVRFYLNETRDTARQVFFASLAYMPALLLALALDRIPR